jgi:hypothetical protein
MKLPQLHIFKKEIKAEYFLAFILRDEKAVAIIFEELAGKAKIIGKGQELFGKSLEEVSEEELLTACDRAISKAEEVLPPNIETQKTIFGLKDEWVEDNKIKKEYLDKLKKISDELGLIPIGFLQISEAILNLLKSEEGAPVTAILAEFSNDFAIVSLVKAGKVLERKGAKISETEALTVDNLLKHFEAVEILPSRIILIGEKSEDYLQQFLSHQWSKTLNFLHLPQAVALPDDLDVKGVLFGAASQLGFSVMADFIKQDAKEEMPKEEQKEIAAFEKEEEIAQDLGENLEIDNAAIEEEPIVNAPDTSAGESENFGFSEEDIAKDNPPIENSQPLEDEEEKIIVAENIMPVEHAIELTKEEEEQETTAEKTNKSFLANVLPFVSLLGKKGLVIIGKIKGRKIFFIPIAVIVLLLILFLVYIFTLKANVILTLDANKKDQTQTVTFVQNSQTDASKNIIASELSSTTEDGTSQTKATGTKDTGTLAKGSLTICSRFTGDKTLSSETAITSSNGLVFTTDNSVDVSSASADASADCSKADISVTAKEFGKEYNLPAGTKFTVGNYDSGDMIAKNDNPFSGGTKKEITVVSKDDLAKAQNDLIKTLETTAENDLKSKLPKDKVLLQGLIDANIENSSANKKVGDESSSLSLKGTVSYKGVVYSKSDLISFVKGLFKDKISNDQSLSENNIQVSVTNISNKNDQVKADLKISVGVLPKIDTKVLSEKIKGMSQEDAISYLSNLPQIANVKINISPNIPFLPKSLPGASGNINISTIN